MWSPICSRNITGSNIRLHTQLEVLIMQTKDRNKRLLCWFKAQNKYLKQLPINKSTEERLTAEFQICDNTGNRIHHFQSLPPALEALNKSNTKLIMVITFFINNNGLQRLRHQQQFSVCFKNRSHTKNIITWKIQTFERQIRNIPYMESANGLLFFLGYFTALSLSTQRRVVGWLMNWEGFGRKRS
jgi:hypothetical protein